MNQDALKNYLRKLVKEAIANEVNKTATVSETKKSTKVFVVKESKQILANEQYVKILEGRKTLIESMISEKGLFDKLGSMFGKVDPSAMLDAEENPKTQFDSMVDDPKHVTKEITRSIAKAQKFAKDFSAKQLNTTATINAFHDSVLDALNKWATLSDTVPEQKAALEKQVVDVARQFYQTLSGEKGRIDSFLKTISADMAKQGIHQSKMSSNPKPKKAVEPASSLRNKEDVPPMNSLGKAVGDMATSWAK